MYKKLRFGLLLTTILFALLFAGCGGTDPDLDPPRLTAIIDASGTGTYTTYNSLEDVTISGTVQAGFAELEVEVDSDSSVTATEPDFGTPPTLNWTVTVSNFQEGNNFIVVSASDDVGNRTQVQLLINLDTTPPANASVYQVLTPTPYNSQTIGGSVSEDAVVTVDGTDKPVDYSPSTGNYLWEYDVTGLGVGDNSITIGVTDAVGNYNSQILTIKVDLTSPGLMINHQPSLDATYNSVTLTGKRGGANSSDIALVLTNATVATYNVVDDPFDPADGWMVTIDQLNPGVTLATATLYNTSTLYNVTTVPVASSRIYLDSFGPVFSEKTPFASSVTAPVDTEVTFRFSEQIQILDTSDSLIATATGLNDRLFELTDSAGTNVSGTTVYNSLTRTATFTPAANLTLATIYNATLFKDDGTYRILDLAGNAIDDATITDWTFTTAAE